MGRILKTTGVFSATATASLLGAYSSARSSFKPNPPTPEFSDILDWVVGMNDPVALGIIAVGTVLSTGLSIHSFLTSASKDDVKETVTKDGDVTRAKQDNTDTIIVGEGVLSEQRDDQTHTLLEQVLASQEANAAERGVSEATLIALAERIVEKVSDPEQASTELHRAIDELLKLREEQARGTNFGDEIDEAIARIFAKVEENDFDGAMDQGEGEFARLAEQAQELGAAQAKLADTNMDVARLAYDAEKMAYWAVEKLKLQLGVLSLSLEQMRFFWRAWYKWALKQGLRLEMDVAIALARLSIEASTNPLQRANCENDLGLALKEQGRRSDGAEGLALLADAILSYHSALQVFTKNATPDDWALTKNNLGNALEQKGSRMGDEEGLGLLADAIPAFHSALEVFTKKKAPEDWAMTQNNLGCTLQEQGRLLAGEEGLALLGDAVLSYRSALEVYTKGDMPEDWAATQNNLGLALSYRGVYMGVAGLAPLAQSVDAYCSALEVYTQTATPADWAMTNYNLGLTYMALGDKTSGKAQTGDYQRAKVCFINALEVRTPKEMPYDYQECSRALADLREKMA